MNTYTHSTSHDTTVEFVNRVLIYGFGVAGILFDSNPCYIISLTVWVWFLPFIKYEWKLIERYNSAVNASNSTNNIGLNNERDNTTNKV